MVPILKKGNYLKWHMCIKAYLTPHDHVCVIKPIRTGMGMLTEPKAPVDTKELALWAQSECMARGIIMATAWHLHLELIYKHANKTLWELWQVVKAKHMKQDASICYAAWMGLLGLRQGADEPYMDYMGHTDDTQDKNTIQSDL